MRFVDEFRDADKAHALAAKIAALCEPGRQYKLMEVCGGHTHTIYKHGLEDYLPESITLVHGPGCPVCVIPMGRVDDAIHLASQPDVIMTSFGDMMRVPGSGGSFGSTSMSTRAGPSKASASLRAARTFFGSRTLAPNPPQVLAQAAKSATGAGNRTPCSG